MRSEKCESRCSNPVGDNLFVLKNDRHRAVGEAPVLALAARPEYWARSFGQPSGERYAIFHRVSGHAAAAEKYLQAAVIAPARGEAIELQC